MSRVLLVDDSPHAQRMGERILSEEGFEVVTVSNADSALIRLEDVDPDVVVADTVMPGRTGYEICQYIKMSPRLRHVRVILTAGVLENFDEELSKRVEADATLKKPFEASILVATVKPLAENAGAARQARDKVPGAGTKSPVATPAAVPFVAGVVPGGGRAASPPARAGPMKARVEETPRRVTPARQTNPAVPATAPDPPKASPQPDQSAPIMET